MVNLSIAKRGRSLSVPSKWYNENRFDAMNVGA